MQGLFRSCNISREYLTMVLLTASVAHFCWKLRSTIQVNCPVTDKKRSEQQESDPSNQNHQSLVSKAQSDRLLDLRACSLKSSGHLDEPQSLRHSKAHQKTFSHTHNLYTCRTKGPNLGDSLQPCAYEKVNKNMKTKKYRWFNICSHNSHYSMPLE